jgi:hypothetical protein
METFSMSGAFRQFVLRVTAAIGGHFLCGETTYAALRIGTCGREILPHQVNPLTGVFHKRIFLRDYSL